MVSISERIHELFRSIAIRCMLSSSLTVLLLLLMLLLHATFVESVVYVLFQSDYSQAHIHHSTVQCFVATGQIPLCFPNRSTISCPAATAYTHLAKQESPVSRYRPAAFGLIEVPPPHVLQSFRVHGQRPARSCHSSIYSHVNIPPKAKAVSSTGATQHNGPSSLSLSFSLSLSLSLALSLSLSL